MKLVGLKLTKQQLQRGQKARKLWLPVMGKVVPFKSHSLKEAKCSFSNKQTVRDLERLPDLVKMIGWWKDLISLCANGVASSQLVIEDIKYAHQIISCLVLKEKH